MGPRKNRLGEAVLTSTHNLCFEQKYENISEFLSENFHFLVVNSSIYLNRLVSVMANSANPDEPPHSVASDLGPHCLLMSQSKFYRYHSLHCNLKSQRQ